MMVKKRAEDQEEPNKKNDNDSTDNKNIEQNLNPDDQGGGENKQPGSDQPGTGDTDLKKDKETDKSEAAEKVYLAKLAEMQDRYIRLAAEFDNYRKRTLKEKMDLSKYAGEDLLRNLLPLMDDFERALKHLETANECAGVKEGINLIYTKFSEYLAQQGVKEINALFADFDVDLHDAVAKVPVNEEDKKGKIVDVLLKGYYLRDKVMRHSKVVIGE